MSDNIQISINIPIDDEGMIGRECLKCKRYFKIKPGTGLPADYCHCPYCEYEGNAYTFLTPTQIKYAESIAMNEVLNRIINPSLKKLEKSFKDLERSSRNSLIQFKVKTSGINYSVPINYYQEKELETTVTCDNCGLVFAIYGVFARCPDCKKINAFLIFEKSIESIEKQLEFVKRPEIPKEIKENFLIFILSSCISTFDALGKELRKKKPDLYPSKPKNLFQNLYVLNQSTNGYIEKEHSDFGLLLKLFQVRHIYEHNLGVIDDDFVKKFPEYKSSIGKKYKLNEKEISSFITVIKELGNIIKKHFEKNNKST